jgi:hypothetical protein
MAARRRRSRRKKRHIASICKTHKQQANYKEKLTVQMERRGFPLLSTAGEPPEAREEGAAGAARGEP